MDRLHEAQRTDEFLDGLRSIDQQRQLILDAAHDRGLPPMHIPPEHGKLLTILTHLKNPRSVLELGTLAGYSTLCLLRGMSDEATITTIDLQQLHSETARSSLAQCGYCEPRVQFMTGDATLILPTMIDRSSELYDLIFIDADKRHAPLYLELCMQLLAPQGLMIIDNTVQAGHISDTLPPNPASRGMRELHQQIAKLTNVHSSTIQTITGRGHDGITLIQLL